MPVANRPARIGKYEITDVIGEGGMGAVYKATDPGIGRTVAIKVIKGDFSDNPELLKRFYREAQAVGNLQHPNIVVVYDLGEQNGSPYLVMEYLDGIPLDKVIAQRQSVPVVQKLGIVIEVLNALHYAHQHNIVHRDVKPANVMVRKDGRVKLLDFGIAREGDLGQTKTGQVMGTMWYMSPEQLNSESVDGRSDVYATGILLYELLAYSLPFDPRDMTGMIVKRLRGDAAPPLSKYLESYPPELDEIIARALTVDREQRYGSAEEFAFDLSRLQERLKRDMVSDLVDEARSSIAKAQLTRAKDLLSEVLRIDTQNPTAKQLLYEIQQTLQKAARGEKVQQLRSQAEEAISAKQLEHAASLLDQAIKLDSTDPDLFSLREQIEQAKSRAQQVKKLLTLAKVAQQTGELVVAKKAVDDALALDPQDTDARMMQSVVARQLVEYEKRRQIQQFLEAARREIAAHQFASAQENVAKAKAIDSAYPEIPGLEKMLKAGLEQEARQRELAQLCSQIEQELNANRPKAARDIAATAMRKFPGEQNIVRLKAAAEAAIEKEERRAYVDERMSTASRLIESGEATRALRLLKDVEREYPTDLRLREYLEVVRQAAAREKAEREKAQLLQQARSAMRGKSFAQAISVLEGGLVQFPEDAEIKDLLKAARDEFELLEKKKQVEEVGKQAQDLLHARAHTDAIRLLERTAAQVSDPELANLLQYARQEAQKFRAGMQQASEQATQMLNLGQHSEAVTFLEAQVDKYGKNADFQVLLEQARRQAEETQRAKARLQANLKEARAKLRSHDIHGAEALLRVCELETPDDPDVKSLAVEIEEEKKAEERRQAEAAERAAREKQEIERHLAEEARRAAQIRQEEERRQSEAAEREFQRQREAAERELQKQKEAAAEAPSFEREVATVLDVPRSPGVTPVAVAPPAGALVAGTSPLDEGPPLSLATQLVGPPVVPVNLEAPDQTVVERAAEPLELPLPAKEKEPKKKPKPSQAPAVRAEAVAPPILEKPVEVAPLRMETVVEPRLAPAPPIPVPPQPPPPEVHPTGKNRLMLFAGGGLALVILAAVVWHFVSAPKTAPPPAPAFINITNAPAGATYRIGDKTGTVSDEGVATVAEPPGNYVVELDKPGYDHFSKNVKVTAGTTASLAGEMAVTPPPPPPPEGTPVGTLVVSANVDHFDVFIDGQPRPPGSGRSKQIKIDNVPEGVHRVEVKKSGYEEPKQRSVTIVAKKESRPVQFELKEKPESAAVITPPPSTTAATTATTGTTATTATATPPPAVSTPPPPPPAVAKPVISSFRAEPASVDAGSKVKLEWSTQGADRVLITPGNITRGPSDSYEVEPKDPQTTYELIASGPGGTATGSVVVTVRPKRDETAEIVAALEKWRSAYESLDMARIRAAFPNVPPDMAAAIQRLSKQNLRVSVAYSDRTDPKVTGETAEMKCTETVAVVTANGEKIPPRPRRVAVEFAKQGEKWVLRSLTASK
jgi:eukaryotic-like serine/threonine-protein kinase